ncbi:hypothetical protein B0A50_00326 [Salinomyces thailandicus]|uniref:feruloyl esterase n=1 Tax=Salinomyces thailandicus TaxID=706561 RepID=A0A4U0UIA7_9PEZI|nr:hypothetical protein B0A50_00326 [Salinomyces thailandica]
MFGPPLGIATLISVALASPYPFPRHTGCGGKHHEPGYHFRDRHGNFSVESGNLTRYYSVQVPEHYNPHRGYGLIFDYHGNTDTSLEQRNNSQYQNYPASSDYVIIYPQGYERHWQGPSYAVPGINDLQFTTDLLTHIKSNYCIDPNRVYASGKSNGAGFVDLLACSDNGDAFAAFAMASAALYTDTSLSACSKRRAVLESHGDNDTTIPYHPTEAGSGGVLPDVGQWIHWWGERDCGPNAQAAVAVDEADAYNITTYSCHQYRDVVKHYHFAKLDHCWPDAQGDNYDALYSSHNCIATQVLDYTSVVLDFFGRWNLENAPRNVAPSTWWV